jgi:hypothetical protein
MFALSVLLPIVGWGLSFAFSACARDEAIATKHNAIHVFENIQCLSFEIADRQ